MLFEQASIINKGIFSEKIKLASKKNVFLQKNMIENLSDKEIIQGLRQYDERVTREFFYDTCLMAYSIDDKKYGLRYKTGMDFYSLAHEYYLRLCTHDWQQLEKCKAGFTLAKWTMNGFHYLVRERLKSYADGFIEESIEERATRGKVAFDVPVDDDSEVKEMVEEICHAYYASDRTSQSILRMILVMGMKGKEVAAMMGISPSAVSQRYRTMFDNVVRPYFIKYYHQEASHAMEGITYARYTEESGVGSVPYMPPKSCSIEESTPRYRVVESKTEKAKGGLFSKVRFWRRGHKEENTVSRITPPVIDTLRENEIFVFGSDLRGLHCGGTAYKALRSFGAVLGQGVGLQGQCYAIPTIVGGIQNIRPYVDDFIEYASSHPNQRFLVTKVGCGVAGFMPNDIAPLFAGARNVSNICLPQEFWDCLELM